MPLQRQRIETLKGKIDGSSAFSLPKSTLFGFTSRGNNAKNDSTTSVRYFYLRPVRNVPQDLIAQQRVKKSKTKSEYY